MTNTLMVRIAPIAIATAAVVMAVAGTSTASQAGMQNYGGSFTASNRLCTQNLTGAADRYGCDGTQRRTRKYKRPTLIPAPTHGTLMLMMPGSSVHGGGGGGGAGGGGQR